MDLSKFAAGEKKYMSKALYDPGKGENLCIAEITEVEFQKRGGGTERKLVIHWVEDRPPLTLNVTNRNWILGTFGPREEHWRGKVIHVFHDPTVAFQGKPVGGLILDAAQAVVNKAGPDPALQQALRGSMQTATGVITTQPKEDPNDDIPF